jgi:hypothetical protein
MRRQNAKYLVFDQAVGAQQWPELARLATADQRLTGLRPLSAPIVSDETPANSVVVYALD